MADYKKVVEMLGENLASLLELAKKWLNDWAVSPKNLLDFFHQLRKEDLLGLISGTHEIKKVDTPHKKIKRTVIVDRKLSAQQALDATGLNQYTNKDVVASMPNCNDKGLDIDFINFGEYVKASELKSRLAFLGYKLVDPFALAKLNQDDPTFADQYPNGTQWEDSNGKLCYAVFNRVVVERYVGVGQNDVGWYGGWWFACIRISTSS